jgi:hypothetical protein
MDKVSFMEYRLRFIVEFYATLFEGPSPIPATLPLGSGKSRHTPEVALLESVSRPEFYDFSHGFPVRLSTAKPLVAGGLLL